MGGSASTDFLQIDTTMNRLTIPPLDTQAEQEAASRMDRLAKPPYALGKLEPLAARIAGMAGNPLRASRTRPWCCSPPTTISPTTA